MAEQSVEFPPELFDRPANIPLIHQVVTAQLAAARQGTHKTKNRGEVSGSGVKPFKQKGTGRSRQGSIRAPEHRGGGIVHGPQPRDYSQRTPKKMIAAALLGALSDRVRAGRVHVVDSLVAGDVPSTKQAAETLAGFANGKRQLVVLDRVDDLAVKSVRNLKHVNLLAVDQLNAYDVLLSDDIVFTRAAFDSFVAAKQAADQTSTAVAADQTDAAVAAEPGTDQADAAAAAEPAAATTTEEVPA
jgi:large subunit ribosomal protein L4